MLAEQEIKIPQIDEDNIKIFILKKYITVAFMINSIISGIIISILIYFILGPSGAKSKILNDTTFFESECIETSKGHGFKNRPGSSLIEACDPSNNSNDVPDILSSMLNGSPSYNLTKNQFYHISSWLVGIGIFTNILVILSPYLHFIPFIIRKIYIKIDKLPKIQKIFSNEKFDNILLKIKENKPGYSDNEAFQLAVTKFIVEYGNDDEIKRLKKLEPNELEPNKLETKELPKGGSEANKQQKGGSNLDYIMDIFTYISEFVGKLGGDKCDSGDVLRLFFGMIHITIILILSSFIKGDPLGISSGLFSLFIGILVVFLALGSNIPSNNLKILYILLGLGSLIIWIYLLLFEGSKNLLSPSSILSICAFIIGLGFLAYFSAGESDFSYTKTSNKNCNTNNAQSVDAPFQPEIDSRENSSIGGGDSNDKESIACLFYNYFSNLSDSLGLGAYKLFLIAICILFTPNYHSKKLKHVLQGIYQGPLNIFTISALLFVLIFDIVPFLKDVRNIVKNNLITDKSISKESGLYNKVSNISFMELCSYDPNANSTNDNTCIVPDKLIGEPIKYYLKNSIMNEILERENKK